jgi:hypothetical protein
MDKLAKSLDLDSRFCRFESYYGYQCISGEIGRPARLKILSDERRVPVRFRPGVQTKLNMDKIRLYLDDVRTPIDTEWVVVRSFEQFASHIQYNGLENYDVISLDHDLGDSAMNEYLNNVSPNYTLDYSNITEKTGMDCAKFLVAESMSNNIPLPQVYVHSANPIGSANIMGYINNYLMNQRLPQTCIRVQIKHKV